MWDSPTRWYIPPSKSSPKVCMLQNLKPVSYAGNSTILSRILLVPCTYSQTLLSASHACIHTPGLNLPVRNDTGFKKFLNWSSAQRLYLLGLVNIPYTMYRISDGDANSVTITMSAVHTINVPWNLLISDPLCCIWSLTHCAVFLKSGRQKSSLMRVLGSCLPLVAYTLTIGVPDLMLYTLNGLLELVLYALNGCY